VFREKRVEKSLGGGLAALKIIFDSSKDTCTLIFNQITPSEASITIGMMLLVSITFMILYTPLEKQNNQNSSWQQTLSKQLGPKVTQIKKTLKEFFLV
jgi:hypothetical protein